MSHSYKKPFCKMVPNVECCEKSLSLFEKITGSMNVPANFDEKQELFQSLDERYDMETCELEEVVSTYDRLKAKEKAKLHSR